MIKKFISFLFFSFICLSYFSSPVFATTLYQNNFESQNYSEWEIISGQWSVNFLQGSYRFGALTPSEQQISIEAQTGDYSWTNYEFSVDILPTAGFDRNILFRVNNQRLSVGYLNLPVSYGLHMSSSWIDLQKFTSQEVSEPVRAYIGIPTGTPKTLRIRLDGSNIKVFEGLNINPFINYTDNNNPILSGRIALLITTGAVTPSEVYFDNVVVKTLEETPLTPIVLLPGMGASWNYETIILGNTQPQDKWSATPGIKIYDDLIQTLKNAGYKTEGANRNLYVFYYNWTKPVSQLADDLKNYLDNTVKTTSVNLIGHSLGGLIARTYLQNNSSAPVDKLLTVAAPHQGSLKAYYLWEGGEIEKALSGWERIATGLLLHLRKPNYSSVMAVTQSVIPSLKDLLPTFAYLKQNSQIKPINQMSQINSWLSQLNNDGPSSPVLSKTNTLLGSIANSTLRWLEVKNRDWLEKLLGLWPDGKPVSTINDTGDDTVLTESGSLNGATITTLTSLHHLEIIQKTSAIQKIMEILNLNPGSVSNQYSNLSYDNALAFIMGSPANVTVFDQNNQPVGYGDNGFVIIPDASSGVYQAKLTGTADGSYRLYTAKISSSDNWTTLAGEIKNNQIINQPVNFSSTTPTNTSTTITAKSLLSQLKTTISQFNNQNVSQLAKRTSLTLISDIVRLISKNNFEESIKALYQLRQQFVNWQDSKNTDEASARQIKAKIQEIINNLENSYVSSKTGSYNQTNLTKEIKSSENDFTKAENKIIQAANNNKATEDSANPYLLAQQKLNKAKTTTSFTSHINSLGSQFLSRELIKQIK